MKSVTSLMSLSAVVAALAACGGTASSDPATQTQAQAASTEGAGGADPKRPPRHPHGPPPEAFEACQSKAAGDACTVVFGGETLEGKCAPPPAPPDASPEAADGRLACRPDRLPEPRRGGPGGRPPGPPPAEVFAACDGKATDAACAVTLGDRTLDGTCQGPPPGVDETRLGCAPSRPPPN